MERVRLIFLGLAVLFVPTQNLYSKHGQAEFVTRSTNFSLFEENGKVGLKNEIGEILIPATYEAIGWSNGKLSIIDKVVGYQSGGQWGLISTSNKRITPAEFLELKPGEGSFLVAQKRSLSQRPSFGVINTAGKIVIPFQYDGLRLANMRAVVMTRSGTQFLFGLTDLSHKILIPLKYRNIYSLGSLRYAVENVENKTAIFSDEGNQLADFTIDSISSFKKDYAIVYQHQRQGLIDRAGNMLLKPVYGGVQIKNDGTIEVRDSDAWFFLDGQNHLKREHQADGLRPLSDRHYLVSAGGKMQLTNNDLAPLHEGFFTSITDFNEHGVALFRNRSGMGVITTEGRMLIPAHYQQIFADKNGFRACLDSGYKNRWVILDSRGKIISQKQYEQIGPYNGKFFPVQNRGFWGAVDKAGKEIITCVHDSLLQSNGNNLVVKFKGAYGVINLGEDWLVTPQQNSLELLNDDAYLEFNGRTTFLKTMKGQLIYFSDNTLEYKDGYLKEHLLSGAHLIINMDGIIIERSTQPQQTEKVFHESEGYRAIIRDGKYGFIDEEGRLRIANRYEDAKPFNGGLAAIRIRGKWGFIDQREALIIQPVYDGVENFNNGYSIVRQQDQYGLIDRNGKVVLPLRYDEITVNNEKRYRLRQGPLLGLADESGTIVIHPRYDELSDTGNGYVIVRRQNRVGLVTVRGVSTIPMIYDGLIYDPYRDQYLAVKKSTWQTVNLKPASQK